MSMATAHRHDQHIMALCGVASMSTDEMRTRAESLLKRMGEPGGYDDAMRMLLDAAVDRGRFDRLRDWCLNEGMTCAEALVALFHGGVCMAVELYRREGLVRMDVIRDAEALFLGVLHGTAGALKGDSAPDA